MHWNRLAEVNPIYNLYKHIKSTVEGFDHSSGWVGIKEVRKPNYVLIAFQFALIFIAIYLSFKCNRGFDLGGFLAALCCAPCYIAYRLAVPC